MLSRLSRSTALGVRSYASKAGGNDIRYGDLLSRLSKISGSKGNANFKKVSNNKQTVVANQRERRNFDDKRDAKKATLERKMSRFRRRPEDAQNRRGNRRGRRFNNEGEKLGVNAEFGIGSPSSKGPNEEKELKKLVDERTTALASFIKEIFGDEKTGKMERSKKPIDEGLLKDLFLRVDSELGKTENQSNSEEVNLKDRNTKEMEERAQFIARKKYPQDMLPPTLKEIRDNFQNSAVIKALSNLKNYNSDFMHDVTHPDNTTYRPRIPDAARLQLSKTKIPFNVENRILIALEKVLSKRGIKLGDQAASLDRYFEYRSAVHPFENPLIAKNEVTIASSVKKWADIPEKELERSIAESVEGARNELRPIIKENQTERAKVNAQVVANVLNSNAQFKVDDIHAKLSQVLTGQKSLRELPKRAD